MTSSSSRSRFFSMAVLTLMGLCLLPLKSFALNAGLIEWPVEVLATWEHDPAMYTQGLYFDGDILFESSGQYGRSSVRRYKALDPSSLEQAVELAQEVSLPKAFFAEGLTVMNDKVYVLTWKEQSLLVFDKESLSLLKTLQYSGQGWGLTHNEQALIMSNGSNRLHFRDKTSFALIKTLIIPGLDRLNELEYVEGIIWANRWYDDKIYAIDAQSGCILGTLNVAHLRRQAVGRIGDNVTNGIAYMASQDALLVTGKYWSKQFLIKLPLELSANVPPDSQIQRICRSEPP